MYPFVFVVLVRFEVLIGCVKFVFELSLSFEEDTIVLWRCLVLKGIWEDLM